MRVRATPTGTRGHALLLLTSATYRSGTVLTSQSVHPILYLALSSLISAAISSIGRGAADT
jgi:hypothetical protein